MVKKPLIIIQARMNSERLPGKVLKEAGGFPLLGVLLHRIKESGVPILLATSTNSENDPLEEYAKKEGFMVFRGSEDHVLERFYIAAKQMNSDLIFRLTGDNPFVDSYLIRDLLKYYLKANNNRVYVSTAISQTFPTGISVEAFGYNLLEEAFFNANQKGELEHVTPYLHQNVPGDIIVKPFDFNMKRSQYRLTVDTENDYKLFKVLIECYHAHRLKIPEIITILDNNPELVKINASEIQRSW